MTEANEFIELQRSLARIEKLLEGLALRPPPAPPPRTVLGDDGAALLDAVLALRRLRSMVVRAGHQTPRGVEATVVDVLRSTGWPLQQWFQSGSSADQVDYDLLRIATRLLEIARATRSAT